MIQNIERESCLDRVDSLGDLVVEPHLEELYIQRLKLECLDCGTIFVPQSGVVAKLGYKEEQVEAYANNTGLHEWPKTVSGDFAPDA